MKPLLHHRMAAAAGALCLCVAFAGTANAAPRARVVSSTWLPGGKYALVYEFGGAEYMTVAADPPSAWIEVPAAALDGAPAPALQQQQPAAPMVSRAEVFPTSPTYVGSFFVDPISAALRATGLGLLLSGDWPHGPRRAGP